MENNVKVSTGTAGGTQLSGGAVSTELLNEHAAGLLLNSIDERIVKVRPMSTPIEQLSRCGSSRHAGAMRVEYYSVDTKKTETTLTSAMDEYAEYRGDTPCLSMRTDDNNIFDVSETVMFPELLVKRGNDEVPLVGYVLEAENNGKVTICPVNGTKDEEDGEPVMRIPATKAGTKVVRMGRAATELDVQSPQFAALPRKSGNYCQIFKMQVEQSTLTKIADKEADWSFSDQEEAAIIDMRMGMEKNFLFGIPAKVFDYNKKEPVYLTGGIWTQTTRKHEYPLTSTDEKDLIELCGTAFTKNAGSKHKILVGGTKLIESLSKINYTKVISAGDTMSKWGIEFKEIRSNFGSLYVVHSEIFDQCGHEKDGMIIDPEYLTKYVHIPFQVETLDLRKSGQRNTDAVVLTEASCLVLRYPDAHVRVYGLEI